MSMQPTPGSARGPLNEGRSRTWPVSLERLGGLFGHRTEAPPWRPLRREAAPVDVAEAPPAEVAPTVQDYAAPSTVDTAAPVEAVTAPAVEEAPYVPVPSVPGISPWPTRTHRPSSLRSQTPSSRPRSQRTPRAGQIGR